MAPERGSQWDAMALKLRGTFSNNTRVRPLLEGAVQAAGLEILGVTDVTPQAHNGVRQRKRRRV